MAEDYCWVCDAPSGSDPCPTCGTALYQQPEASVDEQRDDAVLDTQPAAVPSRFALSPTIIAAAVIAVIVVIFLVFRSGAVIS